ncbi:Methyltryptophan resistance [Hyphodiscus hymeniophilus]|uniref:Methyltryptophan resistance n=1 Tax=Hyphodiscus hymeniophilus TaxID=353542 RepID=A0A9P6VND1_9HELO|nr:Methyltryptophan resistance [Hyphodiscus hymeniophilus]
MSLRVGSIKHNNSSDDEKVQPSSNGGVDEGYGDVLDPLEENEVFKKTHEGVNFRTVGWPRASVIFLKVIFATGVLSIPTAMYSLGAVGGSLSVIGWGLVNTYEAVLQGNFRNAHPGCHSIADMAEVLGGVVLKEIVGALFLIAYVLSSGSGILGVSIALNALSTHGACTVWFSFVATVLVIACASVRKFHSIGWLTWAGFASIFIAVLIVVIAVTTRDRPAAAPQTGPYELGYFAIAHPTFVAGIVASATIFVSSAGTSAFLPVISEMRQPKDYNKALYVCMAIVQSAYLAFALVVYRWCGQWVTSPSLGSAGPTIKKVSYGIGLIGLIVSACLYLHVAAKYLFVRILRNSPHLQKNTVIHWGTWLGCTIGLGTIAFILAEAVPIFNYLLALTGSLCFAPIAIALPGCLWLYDFWHYKNGSFAQKLMFYSHCFLPVLGAFLCVGGTYGTVQSIIEAYASSAFSCADNSGSTSAS